MAKSEPEHKTILIMALTKGKKVSHRIASASMKGNPSIVDLTYVGVIFLGY